MSNLDKIMKPKSVAVIGASTKEHTIGSDIMKRLQEYKFNGNIYPVNPKGGVIEGLQAYTSILEVPGEVDLAIIELNKISINKQLTIDGNGHTIDAQQKSGIFYIKDATNVMLKNIIFKNAKENNNFLGNSNKKQSYWAVKLIVSEDETVIVSSNLSETFDLS